MSMNNSVVATYANHRLVESDVRELQTAGFDMRKLSIVGKDQHSIVGKVEGAAEVGGLSELGAALYSIGVPKENVLDYEAELNAGRFLLVAHGTADEIAQAKNILDSTRPEGWDGSVSSSVYYGCFD